MALTFLDVVAATAARCASPLIVHSAMDAFFAPELLRRSDNERGDDVRTMAASEASGRWVWQGPYGSIVIEVIGDSVYVDGDRVEPYRP